MPSYGFMMSQVCAHKIAAKSTPLRLGTLRLPTELGDSGTDALLELYGIMNGLRSHRIDEAGDKRDKRHLTVTSVEGRGRCIRFTYELGRSGQDSTIVDPDLTGGIPFRRSPRHIETLNQARRGLIVLPDRSTAGLLVVEAHGRAIGRDLLKAELKRSFRRVTDRLILDVDPIVDAAALAKYLETAAVNRISLRAYHLPRDLADQLDLDAAEERERFTLRTDIEGPFKRRVLRQLQENQDARKRLLVMNDIEYNELSVQVQSGDRTITLAITGERAPNIINVIGSTRPDDDRYYKEVAKAIAEVAGGLGVRLAEGWADEPWSEASQRYMIEPVDREEEHDDEEAGD